MVGLLGVSGGVARLAFPVPVSEFSFGEVEDSAAVVEEGLRPEFGVGDSSPTGVAGGQRCG